MVSARDFRPMSNPSNPMTKPDDWLSARRTATLAGNWPGGVISTLHFVERAGAGQLRTWAQSLVVGETRWHEGELPASFWQELCHSGEQNWDRGDFKVSARVAFEVRARGVFFYGGDLAMLFPWQFGNLKPAKARTPSAATEPVGTKSHEKAKGGRKPSPSWPQWVAEVVAHIHENGIPDGEGASGVDMMLQAVADRLAERGLDGPARTTSQETMRAVLLRLRGAGN